MGTLHGYNRSSTKDMFDKTAKSNLHIEARAPIMMESVSNVVEMHPHAIKVACSNCNLRELCMPLGLSSAEVDRIDQVVSSRRKIKRGTTLFRNGEKFTSLYAIRTGFFKTCVASEDGRDQVTGFQMAGEVMGLDGIVNDHHTCDAVALEDAEVCIMPFERIEELSRETGTSWQYGNTTCWHAVSPAISPPWFLATRLSQTLRQRTRLPSARLCRLISTKNR